MKEGIVSEKKEENESNVKPYNRKGKQQVTLFEAK